MGNVHAKRPADGSATPGSECLPDHGDNDVSMRGGATYPGAYNPQSGHTAGMNGGTFGMQQGDMQAIAGFPAQPKLMPTVITWNHGGNHVEVEGSFDSWTSRQALQRSGKNFTIVKLLPPGVYQYKFVVDGEWRCAPDQDLIRDDVNNVNNTIEVHEYTPENLESLSDFDAPPSPPSSYDQALPVAEDYTKEPPPAPAHLQLTLLNVPPALDVAATLPRPQHVVLNHIYCQRPSPQVNAVVVGATHRYRSKYVTTILFKPRHIPGSQQHASGHRQQQQQQQQHQIANLQLWQQQQQQQQQQGARGHQHMQAPQQQHFEDMQQKLDHQRHQQPQSNRQQHRLGLSDTTGLSDQTVQSLALQQLNGIPHQYLSHHPQQQQQQQQHALDQQQQHQQQSTLEDLHAHMRQPHELWNVPPVHYAPVHAQQQQQQQWERDQLQQQQGGL